MENSRVRVFLIAKTNKCAVNLKQKRDDFRATKEQWSENKILTGKIIFKVKVDQWMN